MSVAEDVLENADVKGFPIVSNDGKRILMGYIGRTDLRYVIGESSKVSLSACDQS